MSFQAYSLCVLWFFLNIKVICVVWRCFFEQEQSFDGDDDKHIYIYTTFGKWSCFDTKNTRSCYFSPPCFLCPSLLHCQPLQDKVGKLSLWNLTLYRETFCWMRAGWVFPADGGGWWHLYTEMQKVTFANSIFFHATSNWADLLK